VQARQAGGETTVGRDARIGGGQGVADRSPLGQHAAAGSTAGKVTLNECYVSAGKPSRRIHEQEILIVGAWHLSHW
jgi:hypothetical protein